ncbi:hypothetical protein [Alkaliphilus serpentinus]|uniref:Uncharacterized protein n=1 Tax=Alkaliphilus serpentinus TaxID=1482731 RepID=A0A833HNH7_9FIRM|nr:hypothetical protein [Alkaliphilus serpentinus]KAB3529329.1 hypothetical protein F8153_09515 [Alkaliphilus serpentinus]
MKDILGKIFPKAASNDYKGMKIPCWIFVLLSLISFIRSCIHLFASDGGAGSIASLDLSSGMENIIFAFGLWGLSQVLYAIIQLLVAFRYKNLIPLMYILLLLETLGRMYIGSVKTPIYSHTPPGAIANYVILPLAIVMLIMSLNHSKNNEADHI